MAKILYCVFSVAAMIVNYMNYLATNLRKFDAKTNFIVINRHSSIL